MQFETKKQLYLNTIMGLICLLVSSGTMLLLLTIVFFIARESWPVWSAMGPAQLIGGLDWSPLANPPSLGLGAMICSTLWTALGAILLAAPIGLCSAKFDLL